MKELLGLSILINAPKNYENEFEDKDAITKQTIGGHLAYMTRKLNIGFTGVFNEINNSSYKALQA